MKKIRYLFLPFLAFLGVFSVKANSINEVTVGYGYTQTYNNVVSSRTWVAYSSNNLVKYNYNLPNSSYIDIDEFDVRMHITNNFQKDKNYTITFNWLNDDPGLGTFLLYYNRMVHELKCYESSWSSTSQSGSNCFKTSNTSVNQGSTDSVILVTISFTPNKNFYGLLLKNYHDNDPYSSYESEGWELTNFDFVVSESDTSQIINNQNQNTQNIINNQNTNTQSITNNQNTNTTNIINNQNQNTQSIINNQNANNQALQDTLNDSLNNCRDSYNLVDFYDSSKVSNANSSVVTISFPKLLVVNSTSEFGAARVYNEYMNLQPGKTYTFCAKIFSTDSANGSGVYVSQALSGINSGTYGNLVQAGGTSCKTFTVPSTITGSAFIGLFPRGSNATAVFTDIMLNEGSSPKTFEKYGQQICKSKLDSTNEAINNLNDTLTDDNIDGANDSASNFFGNFTTETYGLTSVITAPLSFIQSLTSKTCSPLSLPLPYVNSNLDLPCMTTIYQQHFGSFLTLYQTITFGIVSYWVIVRIFNLVKDFKNPDHDEIEVMDL